MRPLSSLLVLLLTCTATAGDERATGDWGGARPWLAERGLTIELDYTAEVFGRLTGDAVARYRGNVDLMLTWVPWPGGELFVYGQNGHGRGVSDDIGATLTVTSLEAPAFTQLSEVIFTQTFGERVTVKLGKQDANADFAAPRAPIFVNASFGVPPPLPVPTFPAPALGAALFVKPAAWLEARAGVYEGAPEIEAYGAGLDDGLVALAELLFLVGPGLLTAGGFHSTVDDRSGGFALADALVPLGAGRSVQSFVRGVWAEDGVYTGGGVIGHGLFGERDAAGIGFGHHDGETFLELFVRVRPWAFLVLEPDAQLFFFDDGRRELVVGLRTRLSL